MAKRIRQEGNGGEPSKQRHPNLSCFITKLKDMFEKEKFTDVTFEASDGTRVAAHRNIVAQWSPVLEALFETSQDQNEKGSIVKINDMDAGTLKLLVSFMYGCTMELPKENRKKHGFALLEAAHKYNVPELVDEMDRQLSTLPVEEGTLLNDLKFVDNLGAERTMKAMVIYLVHKMAEGESKKLIQEMIKSSDSHDRELAAYVVAGIWSTRNLYY